MGIFSKKKPMQKRNSPGSMVIPWGAFGTNWSRALEQNPSVFSCEQLISNAIASLPVDLLFKKNDGSRVKAYTHPMYNVLKREPNTEEVPQVFYGRLVRHLLRGNAFLRPIRDRQGRVIEIFLLDPATVSVERNDSGKKIFKQGKNEYSSKEILHIPGVGYDGVRGYSPLEFAKSTLETASNIEAYAARAFEGRIGSRALVDISSMYPDGATDDDIREMAAYLRNNYSGEENEGKPLILWDGMKVNSIEATDNRESQLLENRQYQNKIIAQIYQVPLFLLGEGENKYNSQEAQNINFLQYTLLPWIRIIEQYLGMLLDSYERERHSVSFNTAGFLRGDHKSRMEAYVKGIQSGIYSVDEVRNLENLTALPESGEVHFIPANLMPLNNETIGAYMASAKLKAQSLIGKESEGVGDDKQ